MSVKGMLRRLLTDQGERSTYDAVSQCNRCGYCEQSCPTYVASGEEGLSPRGRNQALRLLLEGKLKDKHAAERMFATCLLCGACQTVCYAHVRVPDLVLEGRRLLRAGRAPRMARLLGWLLLEDPRLLEILLKASYFLKRLGVTRLVSRLGVLDLLGFPGLAVADLHVDDAPKRLLREELLEKPELLDEKGARWLYFAPCGPNYLLPRVGRATTSLLSAQGKTAFLDNPCCGLLPFNYGNVETARALAKKTIGRAEKAIARADGEASIVGDCSSCVAHLKSYPQLFADDPDWRPRAEAFAARVRDVVELCAADLTSAAGERAACGGPSCSAVTTYHDSCRARNGQGIATQPRETLKSLVDGAYKELPEADVCCGGAGAFAFLHPELSEEVLRRKISAIAGSQASVVATSSTSCLLQLAHGLRKYYPEGRVVHLSELAAEGLAMEGPPCYPSGEAPQSVRR